jgi:hypothetical protein
VASSVLLPWLLHSNRFDSMSTPLLHPRSKGGTLLTVPLTLTPLLLSLLLLLLTHPPCSTHSQAVLLSEKRGKERAAALAAKRAGKGTPKPKKSEAQKKVARDFYNQVRRVFTDVIFCYVTISHLCTQAQIERGVEEFGTRLSQPGQCCSSPAHSCWVTYVLGSASWRQGLSPSRQCPLRP